ncbi:MAG: tetratricopeptide repeat protein, partial [Planctomycetota bacterium]
SVGVVVDAQQLDAARDLRARAQFLIGETYLMQDKFGLAISAYRRVEPIQAEGHWAAAALVQAGKSFERLGRSQESRLCYERLLQRFPRSRFVAVAQQRIEGLPVNRN